MSMNKFGKHFDTSQRALAASSSMCHDDWLSRVQSRFVCLLRTEKFAVKCAREIERERGEERKQSTQDGELDTGRFIEQRTKALH